MTAIWKIPGPWCFIIQRYFQNWCRFNRDIFQPLSNFRKQLQGPELPRSCDRTAEHRGNETKLACLFAQIEVRQLTDLVIYSASSWRPNCFKGLNSFTYKYALGLCFYTLTHQVFAKLNGNNYCHCGLYVVSKKT